jgi:hypothetical protein
MFLRAPEKMAEKGEKIEGRFDASLAAIQASNGQLLRESYTALDFEHLPASRRQCVCFAAHAVARR